MWIIVDEDEQKITDERATYNYPPQWSFDGKMLLYQKEVTRENLETQNEIWVYELETERHRKIFYDGYNPKWSPIENIISFNSGGVLNISNLSGFYNIALGVDDYEWHPDGKGFIASSSASLRPDGWTHPVLYTISIEEGYQDITDLTKHVKKLFVIPKEVGIGNTKILSISAEKFAYSPNQQWISFIISPTASWSMDSDMLAIISADGKEFEVIDEVILEFTPKWAFKTNLLGYIAGGGRIVYGFKNKDLKVTEFPTEKSVKLTPKNYAEMGFTWVNDSSLIVSRVPESEWSNSAEERPDPSLYFLTLTGQKQIQITTPPENEGDYNPIFLSAIHKITWLRKSDIANEKADLYIANSDGSDAKIWVKNIESYSFFSSNH
ncbi:TolB domain-containing protein [Sporosarcina pasteurii]|uniref:TolB domain-containing protein n=1 Tax=Sporosarcina pasteurii TaxID=1474 RepID=UPI00106751A0|nr:TolB domain-containing protein [Sporosarcina pasteurii]MDS9471189.1 TolB domain-containing protein [Sporosarcina pasteurii]QBQ05172.1 TolB domain-containing protein [Sporosarcina pasteurii]